MTIHRSRISLISLTGLALAAAPSVAQTYNFTVNQQASTVSYTITVITTFRTAATPDDPRVSTLVGSAAGADGIVGNADDTAAGTRTVPGFFGGNTALNTPIPLTSGSANISAASGASPPRPTGTYILSLAPGAAGLPGTVTISGLDLNLLGGAAAGVNATVTIGFGTFRTRQPSCLIPGLPINVPIGNTQVTALTAQQVTAQETGALVPVANTTNQYTFAVPVPARITPMVTLSGAAVPVDPIDITLVFGGTVTVQAVGATSTVDISVDQTSNMPLVQAIAPAAFDEPLCMGHLLANLVLSNVASTVQTTSHLVSTGVAAPDPADFNRDGIVDPDDLADFISGFFSTPADPRCDFNGDGLVDPDDLADYIVAFF